MKPKRSSLLPVTSIAFGAGLAFFPAAVLAQTDTWDGGGADDNFGTGSNWVDDSAPSPGTGSDLFFAGTTRLTPNNNYTAFDDFRNITFNSLAGPFTLGGNAIDLYGKIENLSSNTQTVNLSTIALNSATANEFNPVNGNLNIWSTSIVNNGNQLKVFGNNGYNLTFGTGTNISGLGSVAINQNSNVVYQSAHTYSGDTFVNAGSLQFAQGGSANSSIIRLGDTITNSPAVAVSIMDADGGTTVASTIVIRPSASGTQGTRTISSTSTSGINTFSGTVALDTVVTITSTNLGGSLAFTGMTIELKNYGLLVNGPGNTTIFNVISHTGGGNALTKAGAGTLTLSGANTFNGTITANNGSLVFDYANAATGNTTNFTLSAANAMTLGGGTMEFKGKTGGGNTTNQTIGNIATTQSTGLSTVVVNTNGGGATTVNAGTLSRASATLLLIDQSSGGVLKTSSSATGGNNGLINGTGGGGGMILVKDSTGRVDYATNSGSNTATMALNASNLLPSSVGVSSTNYKLDGGQTQNANTTSQTLRINSTGAGQSLALGTTNLIVSAAGLLFVGSHDYSITGSGNVSNGTTNGSGFIEHFGTGKLTLTTKLGNGTGNANFYGNGSNLIDWNSTSNITPDAATGKATHLVSNVTVRLSDSGALNLTNLATNALGTGQIFVNGGGIVELASGNFTRNTGTTDRGQININGNGGFSAFGANRVVNFGNGAQTWGSTAGFMQDGATLILGSGFSTHTLDLQNAINLGANQRVVEVRDGAENGVNGASIDAMLSGTLTSTGGGLTKTGSGTLELSNTGNSYTGATHVHAGKLLVNGSLTGTGAVTVASTAILGGSGTIAGNITISNGGILAPGNSPGILSSTGTTTFNSGSIFSWELNSDVDHNGTPSPEGTRGANYDGLTSTISLWQAERYFGWFSRARPT